MSLFKKLHSFALPILALALCATFSVLMGCGGGGGGSSAPGTTAHLASKVVITTKTVGGDTVILTFNSQGTAGTYTDNSNAPVTPAESATGTFTVASYSETGQTGTLVITGTTVTTSNPAGAITPNTLQLDGNYTIAWNSDFTHGTWAGGAGSGSFTGTF